MKNDFYVNTAHSDCAKELAQAIVTNAFTAAREAQDPKGPSHLDFTLLGERLLVAHIQQQLEPIIIALHDILGAACTESRPLKMSSLDDLTWEKMLRAKCGWLARTAIDNLGRTDY